MMTQVLKNVEIILTKFHASEITVLRVLLFNVGNMHSYYILYNHLSLNN